MTFKELTKEEFNRFASSYIHTTIYQSTNYADFSEKEGYKSYYVGLTNSNSIIAACLVLAKGSTLKYGYIPKGILIDYSDYQLLDQFTKELKKFLSKKDIVAVKLNPFIVKTIFDSKYSVVESNKNFDMLFNNLKKCTYNHLGYNKYFESLMPRYEAIISLTGNKYDLFKNLTKQFRTKARSSENKGVRIYKGTINELEEIYNSLPQKRHPLSWYKNMLTSFNDDVELYYAKLDIGVYLKTCQNKYIAQEKANSILNETILNNRGTSHSKLIDKKMEADYLLSEYHKQLDDAIKVSSTHPDGLILCLAIVAKDKNGATILDLSYDKDKTRFNASHLLIWKLIEHYQDNELQYLNLGGVTINEFESKYNGLNKFKLSFGSTVYEYIGDFELISNYPKYIMYRNGASLFK